MHLYPDVVRSSASTPSAPERATSHRQNGRTSVKRLRPGIKALVLPRLDCGSATLVGFPNYLLDRLQSVLSAAARFIC